MKTEAAAVQSEQSLSPVPESRQSPFSEKQGKTRGRFLNYIHHFRGIAIIFIVAGHCINLFHWAGLRFIEKILRSILMNGTVLFVFVAGFLFQHLSDRYSFPVYMKKKMKNVIAPYLIISIPVILYYILTGYEASVLPGFMQHKAVIYKVAAMYLIGSHLPAFWFIPMISLFFILSPLLIALGRSKHLYRALPLLLVIAIFVHRSVENRNILHNFLCFFPVYVLGMWASLSKETIIPKITKMMPFLIAVFLLLVGIEVAFYSQVGNIHVSRMFSPEKGLVDINLIQKIILCAILLGFLKKREDTRNKYLSVLADTSFGIYFVHSYILFVLIRAKDKFDIIINGTIIYQLLVVLIVLALSVLSVKFIKKGFREKSRYLTGY